MWDHDARNGAGGLRRTALIRWVATCGGSHWIAAATVCMLGIVVQVILVMAVAEIPWPTADVANRASFIGLLLPPGLAFLASIAVGMRAGEGSAAWPIVVGVWLFLTMSFVGLAIGGASV